MNNRSLALLFLLLGVGYAVRISHASAILRVNETTTQVLLAEKPTKILLGVENPFGYEIPAQINLEVLDTDNRICTSGAYHKTLLPGSSTMRLPLNLKLDEMRQDQQKNLVWYRLRYRIEPGPEFQNVFSPVSGTISFSEITPDLFQLRAISPQYLHNGRQLQIPVRTIHPISGLGVPGVKIEGKIEFEGVDSQSSTDRPNLTAKGMTDQRGSYNFDLIIPENFGNQRLGIKIKAQKGDFQQEITDDVEFEKTAQFIIHTDKPIYQPGQVLHIRAILFDHNQHAISQIPVNLTINDPEGSTVYRTSVQTSRFGVANADWSIPEQTRLGDYLIEFNLDDNRYHLGSNGHAVKISRYDLPNFAVKVTSDRGFYLPEQNAEVEVRADYLFGQPVKHAKVRLVHEEERQWNFREQKWEAEVKETVEGQTDEQGRFTAQIDLKEYHEELDSRFKDLTFAAYVTDPTTGRTEEHRCDLRVTKQPVHVYVNSKKPYFYNELSFPIYVSTSYADGIPAQCRVRVFRVLDSDEKQYLESFKTNRLGVVKINQFPSGKLKAGEELTLHFEASDDKGQMGEPNHDFTFQAEPTFQIQTDKTLYHPGESIQVNLSSTEPDQSVFVDVLNQKLEVLESKLVLVRKGRALVTFPYSKEFKNVLVIEAYTNTDRTDDNGFFKSFCRVYFPQKPELKLEVQSEKNTYQPGEEVTATVRTSTHQGTPVESALGVVLFDKAVEERTLQLGNARAGFSQAGSDSNDLTFRQALGGITLNDLNQMDASQPFPKDLDLMAEILLNKDWFYRSDRFLNGDSWHLDQKANFLGLIQPQLAVLQPALEKHFLSKKEYPVNEKQFKQFLGAEGVLFDDLRDPWGNPYHIRKSVQRDQDHFEIVSAGADKKFSTVDDFVGTSIKCAYFRPLGETLQQCLQDYHNRTKGFIRDGVTLKTELKKLNLDFDTLRDRWGKPYEVQFDVNQSFFETKIICTGNRDKTNDAFVIWTASIDYFEDYRTKLRDMLASFVQETSRFPQNEAEFREALQKSKVDLDFDSLVDPWGKKLSFMFSTKTWDSKQTVLYSYLPREQKFLTDSVLKPILEKIDLIELRSSGLDGKSETFDDFTLAVFPRIKTEYVGSKPPVSPSRIGSSFPEITGVLFGTLNDQTGAVISGVRIQARNVSSGLSIETSTDEAGRFYLGLLPGVYQVTSEAEGFKPTVVTQVPVAAFNITELKIILEVGTSSEIIEVTGGSALVQTQTASLSRQSFNVVTMSSDSNQIQNLPLQGRNFAQKVPVSTPRLREYFPETLVWQPSLETDAQGRAHLKFKLADNITTWKMSVIASTVDGKIETAEKELVAFQPFFVDLEPPKILTEGDEISLPVAIRNYLPKDQTVDLEIKPENWFFLMSPKQRHINVPSGNASTEIVTFKAIASTKEGKQRLTARGLDASDAIEKPVSVHPDGPQIPITISRVFSTNTSMNVTIPETALKGSTHTELKIYPNSMAHIFEGIEGLIQRPYGCGEQTISSTYPNLLVLQAFKKLGKDSPQVQNRAQQFLKAGYERLLGYRAESGGFTYWGRGEADLALTAYALKFLTDAKEFLPVDEQIPEKARQWIIQHQKPDGSWNSSPVLTAHLARILAAINPNEPALKKPLEYLSKEADTNPTSYFLAAYALAALDSNAQDHVTKAIAKLHKQAKEENGAAYWNLEGETPFHGWGQTGNIETTALVLQALIRHSKLNQPLPLEDKKRIEGGLLYLVTQKDSYGVWFSTQATINVLNALILGEGYLAQPTTTADTVEVLVNGRQVAKLIMPDSKALTQPLKTDLSEFIISGTNQIEIRRPENSSPTTVQLVSPYYISWVPSKSNETTNAQEASSGHLRLKVSYDHLESKIGDEITCHVEAERLGYGYGMLLCEIGLPPGADVDRTSLENLKRASSWYINQYDVLPDKVIVYLWPGYGKGATHFEFKFRSRYGIKAKTAPSVMYDYYNPEAQVVVPPAKFVVR